MNVDKGQPGPDQQPFIWIALLDANDEQSLNLLVNILEGAGIETVCEGGLGHIEVAVRPECRNTAMRILRADSRLAGKRIRWPVA
jgi:hypothetical protein